MMAKNPGKRSRKGIGECGNPQCSEPKAPESFLCIEHRDQIAKWREEDDEDPWLIPNQRSDSNVAKKQKRRPTVPTCTEVGCYNERVPPSSKCFAHESEGTDDI